MLKRVERHVESLSVDSSSQPGSAEPARLGGSCAPRTPAPNSESQGRVGRRSSHRVPDPRQRRHRRRRGPACCQASYLKDSETRARYATTLPSSTFMSSLLTSATRRSRNDFAAVSTALVAASPQDTVLVPMISVTRYTPLSDFFFAIVLTPLCNDVRAAGGAARCRQHTPAEVQVASRGLLRTIKESKIAPRAVIVEKGEAIMDGSKQIARVKAIRNAAHRVAVIASEPATIGGIYRDYVLFLAAIPAVSVS